MKAPHTHDWSERGNQAPQNYKAAIETRLGTARDLDDFTRKAQFVNYENFRAMFEARNANLWDNASGLMLWMSHPAWHSTVWQTYDYDFDVNGAYFGCRSACEPLHVQADPVKWQVIAVNHTRKALKGAPVRAETYDLTGRRIASPRTARVDVAPAASAPAFTAAAAEDLPDLHLLRLTLTDEAGKVLSRNTYWRCRTPEALRGLNQVQRAKLSASLTHVSRDGDRRTATATVRNRGSVVAAMVRLSVLDEEGARVLPTLYDDNYLWLLPGESRTITLSWPASALPSNPAEAAGGGVQHSSGHGARLSRRHAPARRSHGTLATPAEPACDSCSVTAPRGSRGRPTQDARVDRLDRPVGDCIARVRVIDDELP